MQQKQKSTSAIFGVLFVGLGALFLLTQLFNISLIGFMWPFFIIVPGLLFFVGMVLLGKKGAPLAIPGSIITIAGLLLLYQNTFNHWESWAYAWALIMPTSIGVGLMITGSWSGVDKMITSGMRIAAGGVALFLAGGFVFEVVFNISGNRLAGFVWPVALIGLGIYLISRRPSGDEDDGGFNEFEPLRNTTPQTEFRPLDIKKDE